MVLRLVSSSLYRQRWISDLSAPTSRVVVLQEYATTLGCLNVARDRRHGSVHSRQSCYQLSRTLGHSTKTKINRAVSFMYKGQLMMIFSTKSSIITHVPAHTQGHIKYLITKLNTIYVSFHYGLKRPRALILKAWNEERKKRLAD